MFEKGRPTREKEIVFKANKEMVTVFRQLATARVMGTLRQLSADNVDDVNKFTRFISGMGMIRDDVSRRGNFQSKQARTQLGSALAETGKGGTIIKAFSADKETKELAARVNKQKFV